MSKWAENDTNVSKPSLGFFLDGFGNGSSVPSAVFNWWMRHVHRRLSGYFKFGADVAADAYLGENDVFLGGYSALGGAHPGGSGETLTQNGVDLDHDGEFLIILEQGVAATTAAKVHIIDLTGNTATRVHNLGTNDDYSAIACNGSRIAISRSNANGDVLVIDYDGTTDFSYQHGAAVRDVCMDAFRVYCVGAEATGTVFGRGHYIPDDGATNWTFTRTTASANLWSCEVCADFVYFAGEGDAGGGNEDFYRLTKSTGATDSSISIGGGTQEIFGKGRIAIGPHQIFVATTSSSAGAGLIVYEYNRFGALTLIDSSDISAMTSATWIGTIDIDDRYLYMGDDLGFNYAIPYREDTDLNAAIKRAKIIGPATSRGRVVCTTGQYLHVIPETSLASVSHIGIGRRPGLWQQIRLDAEPSTTNEAADWFRRKFIPIGDE